MNSIYTCKTFSIVLADIDHIEHRPNYSFIITKHTTYDNTIDDWMNPTFVPATELEALMAAWNTYCTDIERKHSPVTKMDEACKGMLKEANGPI